MSDNFISNKLEKNNLVLFDCKTYEIDLNKELVTQWKGVIVPNNDQWYLEGVTIDFDKLKIYAEEKFIIGLKIVMASRSTRSAYKSINNDFNRIKYLLRFVHKEFGGKIKHFSFAHIARWRTE